MADVQPIEEDRLDRPHPKRRGRKAAITSREANSKDWTIKRLSPATIDVTREAARRSGMKINAWVGKALERAATGSEVSHGTVSAPDPSKVLKLEESIFHEISRLRAQNEDLVQTVNSMSAILLKMYTAKDQS